MSKIIEANADEVTVETKNEVAPVREGGFIISANDIDIPLLNVLQKTSDIDGDYGDLVLDKTHRLTGHEEPIKVIPLPPIKGWKEDVPFDDDYQGRTVYTEAAAKQLEQTSDYKVIECAELRIMFPEPEGKSDPAVYPLPIGDTNYALGRLYVHKDAYRQTYKRLATFQQFNPTVSISTRQWTLEVGTLNRGKYSWAAPELTVTADETPADVVEFMTMFQ